MTVATPAPTRRQHRRPTPPTYRPPAHVGGNAVRLTTGQYRDRTGHDGGAHPR
ncbi:hypothetical protein [Streptomyces sp. NPDC002602]|uniref:hypothetical protein n=1 Tax=Streptomyces sp. NPDC002602 TaxID=3364654 RepID=UPI0036C29B1F